MGKASQPGGGWPSALQLKTSGGRPDALEVRRLAVSRDGYCQVAVEQVKMKKIGKESIDT